ncbi:MAG: GSCFA domain-containing protein [Bacteroidales bacterium]|nr:GSCFA domain-containing protein [Bacteroidales bacterium]
MLFRTEIDIPKNPIVDFNRQFLLLGSCFGEHIGEKLLTNRFPGCVNPFGVLYNPKSIAAALQRLWLQQPFTEDELFEYGGLWHSNMHHGSFSATDKQQTLQNINDTFLKASADICNTKTYIITFGNAWVYENAQGIVVANCHKQPQQCFTQRRLTMEEIVTDWQQLIQKIHAKTPDADFIFTVSPMRYREHGPLGVGTNKAVLLLAVEELIKQERVHYFPSYEIVMDELRDYRFYASDMIHPSEVAIDYIWHRFAATQLTKEATTLLPEIEKIIKQLLHRPLHPDSEEAQQCQQQLRKKIAQIQAQYPNIKI